LDELLSNCDLDESLQNEQAEEEEADVLIEKHLERQYSKEDYRLVTDDTGDFYPSGDRQLRKGINGTQGDINVTQMSQKKKSPRRNKYR
jgi:hypothetical protein